MTVFSQGMWLRVGELGICCVVWSINKFPFDTTECIGLDLTAACLHTDICPPCEQTPPLRPSVLQRGSQRAKLPPLTHLPTPNPSASLLTSLCCWASEKQCKPAWASAGRYTPPPHHPPPPSSDFFLPYVHTHTHTHIRLGVLMRASHCLYSLSDIWPST